MKRKHNARDEFLRSAVAQEAARIMAEQGINDFLFAKRKAAERWQIRDQSALPSNQEIEAALRVHQSLFNQQHDELLLDLRHTAVNVMQLLIEFEPRLVGTVLAGVAAENAVVQVHAFSDHTEAVMMRLMEQGIDAHHAERKLRYEAERVVTYPSFKFFAGEHAVEVVVLTMKDRRQAPLSPVDGKPMARADLEAVRKLLSYRG